MSSVAAAAGENQLASNLRLLELAGWAGEVLLEPYQRAVELEPTLADTRMKSLPRAPKGSAWARPGWKTPDGMHEVYVPLHDDARSYVAWIMRNFPTSVGHNAESLGVTVADMSPELVLKFMTVHELGHTLHYADFVDSPKAYGELTEQEYASLPVPYATLGWFKTPAAEVYALLHREMLHEKFDVSSLAELAIKQENTYREFPTERYADALAVRVLTSS